MATILEYRLIAKTLNKLFPTESMSLFFFFFFACSCHKSILYPAPTNNNGCGCYKVFVISHSPFPPLLPTNPMCS